MTDQEINIAIAESVGWKPKKQVILCTCQDCGEFNCSKDGEEEMPNYVADLNAMHEVEKTLTLRDLLSPVGNFSLIMVYIDTLIVVTRLTCPAMASARQRAEAYLKTIGKWREEA